MESFLFLLSDTKFQKPQLIPTSIKLTKNAWTYRMCELCEHTHTSHACDIGSSLVWVAKRCRGGLFWITHYATVLLHQALWRSPIALLQNPYSVPQIIFTEASLTLLHSRWHISSENKHQVAITQSAVEI